MPGMIWGDNAVASGKQRFDAKEFAKLGDFGDGTDASYRWGYYLRSDIRLMHEYAEELKRNAPWDDTR